MIFTYINHTIVINLFFIMAISEKNFISFQKFQFIDLLSKLYPHQIIKSIFNYYRIFFIMDIINLII